MRKKSGQVVLKLCFKGLVGLLWWSSGWDSTLSVQGAWFPSLVGELRSHRLCSAAKKFKKRKKISLVRKHIIDITAQLWYQFFLWDINYFVRDPVFICLQVSFWVITVVRKINVWVNLSSIRKYFCGLIYLRTYHSSFQNPSVWRLFHCFLPNGFLNLAVGRKLKHERLKHLAKYFSQCGLSCFV